MVWGIIRFVIFTAAFLFGVLVTDTTNSDLPQADSTNNAKTLVVGCGQGEVIVTPTKSGAVHLKCSGSDMFVIGDDGVAPEKIPARTHQLGPVATIQH